MSAILLPLIFWAAVVGFHARLPAGSRGRLTTGISAGGLAIAVTVLGEFALGRALARAPLPMAAGLFLSWGIGAGIVGWFSRAVFRDLLTRSPGGRRLLALGLAVSAAALTVLWLLALAGGFQERSPALVAISALMVLAHGFAARWYARTARDDPRLVARQDLRRLGARPRASKEAPPIAQPFLPVAWWAPLRAALPLLLGQSILLLLALALARLSLSGFEAFLIIVLVLPVVVLLWIAAVPALGRLDLRGPNRSAAVARAIRSALLLAMSAAAAGAAFMLLALIRSEHGEVMRVNLALAFVALGSLAFWTSVQTAWALSRSVSGLAPEPLSRTVPAWIWSAFGAVALTGLVVYIAFAFLLRDAHGLRGFALWVDLQRAWTLLVAFSAALVALVLWGVFAGHLLTRSRRAR